MSQKEALFALLEEAQKPSLSGEEHATVLGDALSDAGLAEEVLQLLFENDCLQDQIVIASDDLPELARSLGSPKGRALLFRRMDDRRGRWFRAISAVILFGETPNA